MCDWLPTLGRPGLTVALGQGCPSVAANNRHLNSVLMPCPFKVLTHGIPEMACGPPEGANGLGSPQSSFQADVCLMRDPGPAQMVQALLPAYTPLVSLAAR